MIIQGVTDAPPLITSGLFANYDAPTGGVTGSTFIDSSGNGRNATIFNSAATTTFNSTTVLRLNSASSQYFGYTSGYGTALDSAFTFEVWAYPLTASTSGTLVGEWSNGTFNSGWTDAQMGFTTSQINCGVYNAGYATGAASWTNNTWYNIVMTYNGSTNPTLRTYVNAVAGGTLAGAKSSPGGTYLSLGKYDGGGSYLGGVINYFNGYVGAWRIYNRALSAAEVSQNFNSQRGKYGL